MKLRLLSAYLIEMLLRSFFSFWIVLSLGIGLTGCVRKSKEADTGRLSIDFSSEPVTLDPSKVEDGLGIRLIVNIMDGLMGFNSKGELVQRLAESKRVSGDLKTYRYKIRSDAKWSDGVSVEPAQIQFAIERALDPKTGSKLSGFLKWIEGASEYSRGQAASVRGISIDGKEIVFKLVKPVSFFDQVLALPVTYPLRADVLAANGGKWDPLRGEGVPTNGAYRIRSSERDQEILLESMRTLSKKAPREVRIRIVSDESTGATLFEEGQLDILFKVPSMDRERLKSFGSIFASPSAITYFLGFNTKKPPFDRVENRRAVAGALRKSELVRVLGGGERPASSWVPPEMEGGFTLHEGKDGRDPHFALEALTAKSAKPLAGVRIAFDSSGRNALVMEKIQADLKSALGWEARLTGMDWKPHVASVYSDPAPIFRFGWSSPLADPVPFLLPFVSGDPFSFTGHSDPKFDRLVEEIVAMPPSKQREARIRQAQDILLRDSALIVPLFHYVNSYAVGPRVHRFEVSPLVGVTLFEEAELK